MNDGGTEEIKPFNMNVWKYFYTNNPDTMAHDWLKSKFNDELHLYYGEIKDELPKIKFMRNNLLNGYLQGLDQKLHRNTFGMIHYRQDICYAIFLFQGKMPDLFVDSSLYDACEWRETGLEESLQLMFPDLYDNNNNNGFDVIVYK